MFDQSKEKTMKDCLFCKIIDGQIPSYKIYEDDYVYAFLDIACDVYGHTLVVPKCHATNVLDCDPEYLAKPYKRFPNTTLTTLVTRA